MGDCYPDKILTQDAITDPHPFTVPLSLWIPGGLISPGSSGQGSSRFAGQVAAELGFIGS